MPVLNATDRLILVKPRACGGQPAIAHPLWDEIKSILSESSLAAISLRAADAFAQSELNLAQTRHAERTSRGDYHARPAALLVGFTESRQGQPKQSYSSIEKLLGCSLAWTFNMVLGCGRQKRSDCQKSSNCSALLRMLWQGTVR